MCFDQTGKIVVNVLREKLKSNVLIKKKKKIVSIYIIFLTLIHSINKIKIKWFFFFFFNLKLKIFQILMYISPYLILSFFSDVQPTQTKIYFIYFTNF
jgi:hypothetical protein